VGRLFAAASIVGAEAAAALRAGGAEVRVGMAGAVGAISYPLLVAAKIRAEEKKTYCLRFARADCNGCGDLGAGVAVGEFWSRPD